MNKKIENVYFNLILESKNFHIEQSFIDLIYNNFELGKIYEYKLNEILKQKYPQLNDVELLIVIANEKKFIQFLNKHPQIEQETGDIKQSLVENFKNNFGFYQKILSNKTVYLIFNYEMVLKLEDKEKRNTIAHELTHVLENDQPKWVDLLPKELTSNNFALYLKVHTLMSKLNISYEYMYYLTSGIQFEALCTNLQREKNNIIYDNAKYDYLIGQEYSNLSQKIKRLYLFIYLNRCFSQDKQRIKYIKENLL